MFYQPGNPGFRQPDEYGRMPGLQPGQLDQPGYGQPGRTGYFTQGQPGYGHPDDIGRAPNQPGYGQFGPFTDQVKRKQPAFHGRDIFLTFIECFMLSKPVHFIYLIKKESQIYFN